MALIAASCRKTRICNCVLKSKQTSSVTYSQPQYAPSVVTQTTQSEKEVMLNRVKKREFLKQTNCYNRTETFANVRTETFTGLTITNTEEFENNYECEIK